MKNAKAGQVQFRVDKAGIIHGTIGRRSFDNDKLQGNLAALIEGAEQGQARPPARVCTCARWRYLRPWAWACASTPTSTREQAQKFPYGPMNRLSGGWAVLIADHPRPSGQAQGVPAQFVAPDSGLPAQMASPLQRFPEQ